LCVPLETGTQSSIAGMVSPGPLARGLALPPLRGPGGIDPRLIREGEAMTYLEALKQIANWEYRSDRRHKGMVDISEIESLKRIAKNAIAYRKGVRK